MPVWDDKKKFIFLICYGILQEILRYVKYFSDDLKNVLWVILHKFHRNKIYFDGLNLFARVIDTFKKNTGHRMCRYEMTKKKFIFLICYGILQEILRYVKYFSDDLKNVFWVILHKFHRNKIYFDGLNLFARVIDTFKRGPGHRMCRYEMK